MKKLLLAIIVLVAFTSCNRSVCPAYMDGGATGTSGANGKKQELFPPDMKKK